ncbi:MAG: polyhydroxyalkanoate synthesis regulator DNA-binding domain-containing protein [Desulfobacterales bacterium]|nr:polyhydroxyalkanoate synthesis regulator DNA-binding domain-containing protein [Desulfobacterales bacterium]
MLKIKKYANGRFFNTEEKKYIKPEEMAELIKKGEEIKVTLTKTGKDITEKVIAQFTEKKAEKKTKKAKAKKKPELPFIKTDKLVKWIGDTIDQKIEKLMDVVKLPSRDQVTQLDQSIKELNKKIDELKLAQEKATKEKTGAAKKTATPKTAPAKPAAAPKA